MSQYIHRMTLVVPEQLMFQANQLALVVGESEHDDKTFTAANWQDSDGNLYSVCSAVIKPIVLSLADISLADSPLQPKGADVIAAQQALDMIVLYDGTQQVTADTIMCAVDYDPLPTLAGLGLTVIELEVEQ